MAEGALYPRSEMTNAARPATSLVTVMEVHGIRRAQAIAGEYLLMLS